MSNPLQQDNVLGCSRLLQNINQSERTIVFPHFISAIICVYSDSMQPLVYKDIEKAWKEIQQL